MASLFTSKYFRPSLDLPNRTNPPTSILTPKISHTKAIDSPLTVQHQNGHLLYLPRAFYFYGVNAYIYHLSHIRTVNFMRYYSLDVFRGATVAMMILVNNPGSWANLYGPLDHSPWHGCTPTDLVFPFFLFAVGNALAFVMPKFEQAGKAAFLKKFLKGRCSFLRLACF